MPPVASGLKKAQLSSINQFINQTKQTYAINLTKKKVFNQNLCP